MGLIQQANEDWQAITSDLGEWGTDITLTNADGSATIDIVGLASKHHIGIDTDGNIINVKNAHISFSEKLVIDGPFVIRNSNDEVNLEGYKATYKDSRGITKTYIIEQWMPDETIGVILCILGDFKP